MMRKPLYKFSNYRLARLDDEFKTVAKSALYCDASEQSSGHSDDFVLMQEWPRSSVQARASSVAARPEPTTPTVSVEPRQSKKRERVRSGLSLKARAVGYLSRREYARNELGQKLLAYSEDPDEINVILDVLEKDGWLSTERFALSLVNRRAPKQGAARIVQELYQHGVDDIQIAQFRETLKDTEFDRAREVYRKRFSGKPLDRAAYVKQTRFLASRGFAPDVIRKLLGNDKHNGDALS